jgi:hypothetical protein
MPRFFAAAASAAKSSGAARETGWRGCPHAGRSHRSLTLAADPLRLSAGGAEPDVATSDTLCRAVGACEELLLLRSPPDPSFVRLAPLRQDPRRCHPVRDDAALSPGCLPPARSSTSRSKEVFHDPFDVRAESLAPASRSAPSSPRHEGSSSPLRATRHPARFASRLSSRNGEEMLLTDLCNRQPTRAPADRSISELAARAAKTVKDPDLSRLPSRRRTASRRSNPGWAHA